MLLALIAGSPAGADFNDAFDLYLRGDFSAAATAALPAAEAGQPAAAWLIGTMRLMGQGLRADAVVARRWYARAAAADYAPAQTVLGRMMETGMGGAADAGAAARLYERAATLGYVDAAYLLGRLLLVGDGLPKDRAAARRWLEKAADAKIAPAEALLSRLADEAGARGSDSVDRACEGIASTPARLSARRYHAVLTTQGMMAPAAAPC